MFENMTKDLTFIDPVCNKPGFHIDDVPHANDRVDYRRIEHTSGRAARPDDPFICGNCGRNLLANAWDAQRLINPLNYQGRIGLGAGRFQTAAQRLQLRQFMAKKAQESAALEYMGSCSTPVSLPQQMIQDAAAGVDAFNLQPFPQPHAVHDKPGRPSIQEFMGLTAVTVDALPEGVLMFAADILPGPVAGLDDDLVAIVANLQQQLDAARQDAAARYDGMMNWKRTAEAKDKQLIEMQAQLNQARDVLRDEMQRGNDRTRMAMEAREQLDRLRECAKKATLEIKPIQGKWTSSAIKALADLANETNG